MAKLSRGRLEGGRALERLSGTRKGRRSGKLIVRLLDGRNQEMRVVLGRGSGRIERGLGVMATWRAAGEQ